MLFSGGLVLAVVFNESSIGGTAATRVEKAHNQSMIIYAAKRTLTYVKSRYRDGLDSYPKHMFSCVVAFLKCGRPSVADCERNESCLRLWHEEARHRICDLTVKGAPLKKIAIPLSRSQGKIVAQTTHWAPAVT